MAHLGLAGGVGRPDTVRSAALVCSGCFVRRQPARPNPPSTCRFYAPFNQARRAALASALGAAGAARLAAQCEGRCDEGVKPTGPPSTMTVEDSFRRASTFEALELVLSVLAPDLQVCVPRPTSPLGILSSCS